MDKKRILTLLKENKVKYLRLQFTDIMGVNKNVEVPNSQFEKAIDGQILFDGSSIEGFARIEESDMLLVPDLDSFVIFPWDENSGMVARLVCDIYHPDGTNFAGCPRSVLKRVVKTAKDMGYTMMVGPEAEFFLFERGQRGEATSITHDAGGYFDLAPVDRGEEARRTIVDTLIGLGFEVEAAHHEVAPGQHEIDFKYAEAVKTADNIATFRFVVKRIAHDFGLHATFMPKPIYGINGSGMHVHQSLFKAGKNAFYDPKGKYELSRGAFNYIGGILKHVRGFTAITNPLVNSFKRLVPGYEAPTHVAWSQRNRSPLCRIPESRGKGTRVELRSPDPSANPYLALAVMLASGLDGIKDDIVPVDPVNKNLYALSLRERRRLKVSNLPGDLNEALDFLEKDKLVRETLSDHIYYHFLNAKREEWREYIAQVHDWELNRYLSSY
ncbi:MAG: type I glutamate--ammonia ligase [Spirochaetota bacterium]|nr:MAG: type I glutamate--ammonia ligase [Spirochaetota bacterium]